MGARHIVLPTCVRIPSERVSVVETPHAFSSTDYIDQCRLSTRCFIVQELCESRGGRPELSVLTSLLVSVDVKNY